MGLVSLTTSETTQDPSVEAIRPTGVVNIFAPDGRPVGLIHASTLTAFRTALASSCLLLRRTNVRTITVFGSGMQAYWHVRLALMMRGSSIKHVNVINRRFSDNAGGLLRKFTAVPSSVKEREGWDQTKFTILTPTFHEYNRLQEDYILAADVLYCCTPSRESLFDGSILTSHDARRKGRLVVAVGSFAPDMRELPEELLLQATKRYEKPHRHFHKHADEGGVIVVDTLEGALKEAGEIISANIRPTQLVELGELVMLHRQAMADSDTEIASNPASPDDLSLHGQQSAMSSVFGDRGSRSSSPTGSTSSGGHKSSFPFHFRRSSNDSSSSTHKKKHEDGLIRWLSDGTVIYKSVGLGIMDLVVGAHLIEVANQKQIHLLRNPNSAHTHTGANAHGGVANLLSGPLELIQQGGHLSSASAAQGVTKGNGTTLGVDLLVGNAQLVSAPQTLAGESLVDLENVDVILRDAGELKSLGDGLPGALAHEKGLDTDDGSADVLAQDGLAKLLGSRSLHQEHSGSAVRNLTGVTGVDAAILGEGRADLAERLSGDTGTDAIVLGDGDLLGLAGLGVLELDLERGNLLVEQASLLGLEGLLVGVGGKGILGRAGNLEVLGHVLRQDAHGNLAVGGLGVRLKQLGKLRDSAGAMDKSVLSLHRACTDTDIDHACLDLVGDVDTGLQTGRALSVQGSDGGSLGEAGDQASSAHLGGTAAGGQDGADADVLDERGVNLGSLDDGVEDTGHNIGSLGVLEATLATLGQGTSAAGSHDNLFGGGRVEGMIRASYIVGVLLQDLVAAAGGAVARDLAANLRDSVKGCIMFMSEACDAKSYRTCARQWNTYHPSCEI
ncbi:hypothetical protein HJFPF1_09032 [Paramyrothecium foliicola]|nr:hypothetical protein HJFPF1_09032 [Paramyrothecium foliicola]